MKKNYVRAALCVFVFLEMMGGSFLFSQDVKDEPRMQKENLNWSLGLLAEGNMNVPKGYALGTGLYGMIVLPDWVKTGRFSAGAKLLYSTGFKKYGMLDTASFIPLEFLRFCKT